MARKIKFYQDQGIKFSKRSGTLLGDIITALVDFPRYIKENKGKEALSRTEFIYNEASKSIGLGEYDAGKTPLLGITYGPKVYLVCGDPDTFKEMFTTKNLMIDKTGFS